MRAILESAGERLLLLSPSRLVEDLAQDCAGRLLRDPADDESPTVVVRVETDSERFAIDPSRLLTRGAWRCDGAVVASDVCSSGFDLRLRVVDGTPEFTFRWRPPARTRLAHLLLRARFRLLARAVLFQYPAMWWAGQRDRSPLHVAVARAAGFTVALAGPGGVGKTTLILDAFADGEMVTDNLCVSDGDRTWGVVEPVRRSGGAASGRRMPHGRREVEVEHRAFVASPDAVVVLQRSPVAAPTCRQLTPDECSRALVTGTYMAGELRRYWPFTALLGHATGLGPAHPAVEETSRRLASRVPGYALAFATTGPRLGDVLREQVAASWA